MGSSQYGDAPTTLNVSGHKHAWTIYIYLREKKMKTFQPEKINNDFNRFELKKNNL